jgi:membrane protein YdbS with pleckstrin-like domain
MPDLFVSKGDDQKTKVPEPVAAEAVKSEIQETVENPKSEDRNTDIPKKYSPLGAFNYYPHNVNFENRDPEEKVILFLRRHPITNLGWISLTLVLVIAPPFLTVLPLFDNVPFRYIILGAFIWYLFTFIYAFERFLDWFFSVNIITDERIFDFDFFNLTYRKVTDVNIDKIQDVTVSIGGGIGTLLNFGDVLIQTAAEIPEIDFLDVPQPDKVAKVLREMRLEEEVEQLEGRVR